MTILELLIAISIIVIISSICFVKYENNNYKIESFARQLCSDIRYVRRENMLDNKNVYIRFINKNSKWSYILHRNKQEDKKVVLPQSVNLNFPVGQNTSLIYFHPDGRYINNGGTITISKNGDYRYITIVPVSGRVLYKEGIYEK
ncbi:GspH/FimT family protein [Terrisporobacter sp.]